MKIDYEVLRRRWTTNPSGQRLLAKRKRHIARIATLKRVLDPKDKNAQGNENNLDSYREELDRRRLQLKAVEAEIKKLANKT